jgi:hypothetical protein
MLTAAVDDFAKQMPGIGVIGVLIQDLDIELFGPIDISRLMVFERECECFGSGHDRGD